MAKWKQELDIYSVWSRAEEGAVLPCELAQAIADGLAELWPYLGYIEDQRQDLISGFRDAAEVADLDQDDFDELMAQLYDWADLTLADGKTKACWIKTC